MAIVTVSRQLGSNGDDIAHALAAELGMQCIDRDHIEQRLLKQGIPEEKLDRFDERKPGFWDSFSQEKDRYLHYLKTAVLAIARDEGAVFLGRGAQIILKNVPGVLHLRFVAPYEERVEHVTKHYHSDPSRAQRMISRSDHDRNGFYRFFFDTAWEAPELYDITINTHELSTGTIVRIAREALERKSSGTPDPQPMLEDLNLAQTIVGRIRYEEKVPIHLMTVRSNGGAVTITGTTRSDSAIERCRSIAERVPGVTSVVVDIQWIPEYTGALI